MDFKYRILKISNLQKVLFFLDLEYKSNYNQFIGFSFINKKLYFYKSITEFNSIEIKLLNEEQINKQFKPVTIISL